MAHDHVRAPWDIPLKTTDPLALLMIGQQVIGTLNLEADSHEWVNDLMDAAAFGDRSGIQRYSQRLDEHFFLFEEGASDAEIAARRLVVACAQTLAVQQGVSGIIQSFPSTWRDGDLVSNEEVRFLDGRVSSAALSVAQDLAGMTIYGWTTLHGNAQTITSLSQADDRFLIDSSMKLGKISISALHAGMLWNRHPEVVDTLIGMWGKKQTDRARLRDQSMIFSEVCLAGKANPIQDTLLDRWLDVYAPGIRGETAQRQVAGQEMMDHPPAWTRQVEASEMAVALYEKVLELVWPDPSKASPPTPTTLLQAVVLGLREIKQEGLAGCAKAAQRVGSLLVEGQVDDHESGLMALKKLARKIKHICDQEGVDLPNTLGVSGLDGGEKSRKRVALGWVGAGAAIQNHKGGTPPRARRKL